MGINERIRAQFTDDNTKFYAQRFVSENYKRIIQILDGKTPPPKELEIQPSSRCNADCDHCFGREFKPTKNKLQDVEDMESLAEQVLGMEWDGLGVEKVKFCGSTGEPLLNPNTVLGIQLLASKPVELFTNGILIGVNADNDTYLDMLRSLSQINVSLDAGRTKTMHRKKPGSKRTSITDILRGVGRVREHGVHSIISYVITEENHDEIVDFAKRARPYADVLNYRIDMTDRQVSEHHKENILDMLQVAKDLETDDCIVQVSHSADQIASKTQESFSSRDLGLPCYLSKFWTCVGPDAELYPCGHVVAHDTPSMGDVLEQGINKIWRSKQRQDYLAGVPLSKCDVCSPFSLKLNKLMADLGQVSRSHFERLYAECI